MEFLMSYGWLLVILVIAGAALYAMGILSPSTYMKTGCVGFEKVHYKDHKFRGTGETGLWTVWSSETERESVFQLRVQNGAGETLRIRGVDVEYPVGVHVTWSERGYDCDYYNTADDTDSGCQEQNVSEAEVTTLSMEDVGRGTLDLRHGTVYRMKVKVTFDAFNALADHSEVAVCSGKIEGGSASTSGSGSGTGSGSSATYAGKWGSTGTGDGQFDSPLYLALDGSGNVHVGDYDNERIQVFDSDGTFLRKWGSQGSGNGEFEGAFGLDVDGNGDVYVADIRNDRVQVFTSAGAFVRTWGAEGSGDGDLNGPTDVVLDGSGNVYVTDRYNNRIQKLTTAGVYVIKWGSSGTGDGQFSLPLGIAVDSSGNVYVVGSTHRVQKFTSDGTFLGWWGKDDQVGTGWHAPGSGRTGGASGTGDGEFSAPWGIHIDTSDRVYVADRGNHRIQVFDTSGTFLGWWGKDDQGGTGWHDPGSGRTGASGSGDGELNGPNDVVVSGNSVAYVVEIGNDRVQKFTIS